MTLTVGKRPAKWIIYIAGEGHWPIDYFGDDRAQARLAYLRWAGRSRLPAGSAIIQVEAQPEQKE
jgi:hypothetical protein